MHSTPIPTPVPKPGSSNMCDKPPCYYSNPVHVLLGRLEVGSLFHHKGTEYRKVDADLVTRTSDHNRFSLPSYALVFFDDKENKLRETQPTSQMDLFSKRPDLMTLQSMRCGDLFTIDNNDEDVFLALDSTVQYASLQVLNLSRMFTTSLPLDKEVTYGGTMNMTREMFNLIRAQLS